MSEHKCSECGGDGCFESISRGTGAYRQRECGNCSGNGTVNVECDDSECDECNPVTEVDVICAACGDHAEMRQETGTECCNAGSRFS
jgi:hypothetical protein